MNVVMVIWSYWPGPQGGAERQCRLIAPYIVHRNCRCTIITGKLSYKSKNSERDGNTRIRRIGFLLPIILFFRKVTGRSIGSLLKFIYSGRDTGFQTIDTQQQKIEFWLSLPWVWLGRLSFICELFFWAGKNHRSIDIVHVHETGWLGAVTVLIGKVFKIPVVGKSATWPPFPQIGWDVPGRMILRRFQRPDHLIVLNDRTRDQLVNDDFPSEKISVIPNAVRIPVCAVDPELSNTVLYVGNFSQGAYLKAFDILFEAWAIVDRKCTGIRLVVAGGGDVSIWQKLVENLGCALTVEFLGFVPDPSIVFEKAGLFVLPSRVEGMSNALLEAFSYGLPVVASDIPANQAVVEQSDAAVLVEVGNKEALADAIIMLMADPDRRKRMGTNGRSLVEKRHRIEEVSAHLVSLYQKLIDNKNGQ